MSRAQFISLVSITALLLTGCTPTTGKGATPSKKPPAVGAVQPPALPTELQATLVVEMFDSKTGAYITPNERDYPLFVTISVFNHDNEEAVGFPEHRLVTRNPWDHTVIILFQPEEFDRMEADVRVPILVRGQGVTCKWTNTVTGLIYPGTAEPAVPHGDASGKSNGMQCILTAAKLGL
jgi:hypothetical protein